jgi:hypothetical protein
MAVQERWHYLLEPQFAPVIEVIKANRTEIEALNSAIFGAPWVLDT